ncbi:MAG: TonB-dependent receptor, partial [Alloprevotella tannerae]|nr:TonB-dependent receptor [Alloprevotella tannerae]
MADHYKLFLAALTPAFAVCAHAQVTTSALGGLITDESGQPAVGATIRAIHTPSGTRYTATTNADGRFTIQGMRPGGPYTVQVTYLGYGTKSVDKLFLQLGDQLPFDLQLKPNESELSEAVVTAVGKSRAGAGQNFSLQKITTTPTIDRNILEVVKFSPMAISSKTGGISFVGSNNRYNSFNIDGVVANDVFGLSAGGTNGSGSGANPISMDAIQEVQVVIAPYDVRQGGFTGGGINAVTKQGTNTMHGSAYGFFNNQNMYGRYSAARDHT